MAIQVLPQLRSTGQQAGQNFTGGISKALEMMTHHKMNQLHQRNQWEQTQKELEYKQGLEQKQKQFLHGLEQQKIAKTAQALTPALGEGMAYLLASNPKMLQVYAEQAGFDIPGLNGAGRQEPGGQEMMKQPEEEFPNQVVGEYSPFPQQVNQEQAAAGQQEIPQIKQAAIKISPQKNHSAYILSTIREPRGKRQEMLVKRAEREQDQLTKQYGKKIDEIADNSAKADAADSILEKQIELINTGNMPSPTAQSIRDLIKHGAGKFGGAALGSFIGGPVGAGLGGSLGAGLDLSSFAGTEGNELLGLNTSLYEGAGKIFPRLTETEFGKFEQGLPLLTDTDEVKIKKINALAYKNAREKILNKHLEDIKEENAGYLTRNIISLAEKNAKKDLHQLEKDYRSGKFGYKYQPKEKESKAVGHTWLG